MKQQEKSTTSHVMLVKKGKEPLTKDQKTFNRLISQVEILNLKIENEKTKNENILAKYRETVTPQQKKFYENQYESARLLANASAQANLSVKQKKKVKEVIIWLCKKSFWQEAPNEDKISFYNTWSDISYEEEKKLESKSMMEGIADEIKNQFGFSIDLSDLDDSPEGHAQLHERLKMRLQEQDPGAEKQKTIIKRNEKQSQAETEKLKSIRAVYISLAKMLHPDLSTVAEDKLLREEMMKQVTIAYNEKNISDLLKLEFEWITKNKKNITALTEDKLKLYISNLKDQIKDLKIKLDSLFNNPRFNDLGPLAMLRENDALREINKIQLEYKHRNKLTKQIMDFLKSHPPKKEILNYISEVEELIRLENSVADTNFDDFAF